MTEDNDKKFLELVAATGEEVDALLFILHKEKDILAKRDFSSLPEILNSKLQSADRIELFEKDLQGAANNNIADYIQEKGNDLGITEKWHELQKKIEKCKALNLANKKITDANQNEIERLLAVLTGKNSSKQETYSASGSKSNSSFGNVITKA
ncbi:MAG: flagellar protein FlgN [Gammaproteobacteria bacterium]|nr:MAG: flagellar protein FlgN [Gammaproteobacteria bacterium]